MPQPPRLFRLSLTLATFASLALAGCQTLGHSDAPQRGRLPTADILASRVHKASGGPGWGSVARIRFTFEVIDDGRIIATRSHDWDLTTGTNTVTLPTGSTTVNVGAPLPADATDAQRTAFQQWTNDSYWLLMPLKLFDGGVRRTLLEPEVIDGVPHEVVELSFYSVGLTPNDRYHLLIDPVFSQLRYWDYIPNPQRKARFSWEDYQQFGPLTLATRHRLIGGTREIRFSGIEVTTR